MEAWNSRKFRTNLHSLKELKIHKDFSYLKLSHIKYSSGLLKQERSKNGKSGKSFNCLIVVGDLTLTFINTECLRVDSPKTTKCPPSCPNFVLLGWQSLVV